MQPHRWTDFYANCLESRYHCGPDGYPIGYGQRYCQKFSDNRGMLDARGQQWMLDNMHCLQLALVGDAVDADPTATTCDALEDKAFASHAPCYTGNGFCPLGVEVWETVLEILGVTTLVSSWDAFKATVETVGDCVAFYAYTSVQRPLDVLRRGEIYMQQFFLGTLRGAEQDPMSIIFLRS